MDFFSFTKNMNKNIGKTVSKKLSGKLSQKLLDHAKQTVADAIKTTPRKVIKKSKST